MHDTESELQCKVGTGVMMTCRCRFIGHNECAPVVRGGDSGGGFAGEGTRGQWELLVLSVQFCCQANTALKTKAC